MMSTTEASTTAGSSGWSRATLWAVSSCTLMSVMRMSHNHQCCSCIPMLGMFTIILNDYPKLKNVLVLSMAIFTVITRE